MSKDLSYIKDHIKLIPDFPKKGVNFRDITPVFQQPKIIDDIIDNFADHLRSFDVDYIAGVESRGFLFGVPLAMKLNKPFVLIRKPNKLPRQTYKENIKLEYGESTIELQVGDIKPNSNVAIIDDLLATGGTVAGVEKLIKQANAKSVCALFLIELSDLKGKNNLSSEVYSILKY